MWLWRHGNGNGYVGFYEFVGGLGATESEGRLPHLLAFVHKRDPFDSGFCAVEGWVQNNVVDSFFFFP